MLWYVCGQIAPFAHAMSVSFKSSPVEFNQHLLFPANIFDLLPKGHECFLYVELFQLIDRAVWQVFIALKARIFDYPRKKTCS